MQQVRLILQFNKMKYYICFFVKISNIHNVSCQQMKDLNVFQWSFFQQNFCFISFLNKKASELLQLLKAIKWRSKHTRTLHTKLRLSFPPCVNGTERLTIIKINLEILTIVVAKDPMHFQERRGTNHSFLHKFPAR